MPGVICRHWGLLASGKPVDMGVRGPRSDNVKSWSSLWHMEGIYPPRQTQWEQLSLTLNSIIITKFIFYKNREKQTSNRLFCMYAELKTSSTSSRGMASRNSRTCCFLLNVPTRADITGWSVTSQIIAFQISEVNQKQQKHLNSFQLLKEV